MPVCSTTRLLVRDRLMALAKAHALTLQVIPEGGRQTPWRGAALSALFAQQSSPTGIGDAEVRR